MSSTNSAITLTFSTKAKRPFEFTATANEPWIMLDETNGTIEKDKRLWVSVDWSKVPEGMAGGTVKLAGTTNEVIVKINAFNPTGVTRDSLHGFVEGEGFVSIEPEHFTKKTDAGDNRWIKIQDYGRTLSGMRATQPVDAPSAVPGKDSPCLEYRMYLVQHRRSGSGHHHLANFEFRARSRTPFCRFV